MVKKIMITVLILIVIGAVSVSVYNTTQARAGQSEQQQVLSSEPVLVNPALDVRGEAIDGTNLENQSSLASGEIAAQPPVQQNSAISGGNERSSDLHPAISGDLSEAEKAALAYMREEEKLAHDVYLTLSEIWGLATFQNIASSEQAHTEAIKLLIDSYGLPDSAIAEVGKFTNPDLQALYNTLIERGSQSLAEAIKVGGAIEEIDILDLQERLSQVDNTDIQQVFNNLLRGSTGHLKAFANALQNQAGEVYQPQYMTQEAFQAILGSATGSGNGRGSSGGGNGQGGNGQSGTGGGYRGGRP